MTSGAVLTVADLLLVDSQPGIQVRHSPHPPPALPDKAPRWSLPALLAIPALALYSWNLSGSGLNSLYSAAVLSERHAELEGVVLRLVGRGQLPHRRRVAAAWAAAPAVAPTQNDQSTVYRLDPSDVD